VAWIRPGQLGYIGPDLGVDLHATPVAVLSIGLDAPFTLETAWNGATTVRSAYGPARTTHRVVAPEGQILLLLIDPAGRLAAAMQRYTGPYALDHRLEEELVAACGHGGDLDILRSLAGPPAPGTTDPRISRLVDDVRADPSRAFRAHETASRLGCRPRTSCGCSPSTPAPPSAATSNGPASCTQSGAWWQDTP
jgi:hypothetical protein